ncbi:MAG: NADH-quinone oxidoreductase subunit N [Bacteroidota bacterium]
MNITQFLIMRHELLLVIILIIIIIAEIFTSAERKKNVIIPLILSLFTINTILGFLPISTGNLFGGMYNTSSLIVLMKNILNIGTLVVIIQSVEWLKKDENKEKISEYFLLLLSTLIGMFFMISAGDFIMFYVGIETAAIPISALVAYERYKAKSAEAGIKFILSSALSSGIMLYGISMIYGTTGSTCFTEISAAFAAVPLQVLAFIFFFAGMAFKISLVPFHLWTADVYEGAPINITSYFSVISKGAGVFILTIILCTVFKSIAPLWKDVIWVISVLTMTIGNIFAMRQKNLKRFLAFSSITQAGFILLGIIAGSVLGMTTVVYFVLIYIFSNLGVFGVVSAISNATGKEYMNDYDSLYKTNPKLSLVMLLSLFSLAGIPPIAGFFGKFFLFTASAQQGLYILVTIAVLNTIISLYYYLLPVKAMFITKNDNPIAYFKSNTLTRIGLIICVIGLVVTGLWAGLFEYIYSLSFGL